MDHIGIDLHKRESQICLLAQGGELHHVVMADPNFAPMYATRTRQVKTDRRDARALAEACLLGGSAGRGSAG